MRIRHLIIGITSLSAIAMPATGRAQQSADSSRYVTAQQMVANGDAVRGRRLVDSLLSAATPGSAQYAEGLYWRATLAPNARDSERDYRQIVVDYPLSSRVPDALLRMGEMEAQRGDREAALQHFQRLTIEHPDSPLRAEANYWIARTYLEKKDTAHGCAANANALAQASASNVELKNRIEYQQQACRGVAVAAVPVAPAAQAAPVAAPATASAATSAASSAAESVATSAAAAPVTREVPVKTAPVRERAESVATTPAPVARTGARAAEKASAKAGEEAGEKAGEKAGVKARAKVAARPAAESAKATPRNTPSPRRSDTATHASASSAERTTGGYAVQVAAFRSRSEAEALVNKLRARGYSAHADGTDAPFRVRIGHYATRAAAVAELRQLKAKKMDGFIAEL